MRDYQIAPSILSADFTGSGSDIVFKPLPSDDPIQRCLDIGLARSSLGWEATVKLEGGVEKTVRYFEGLLQEGIDPDRR